MGKRPEWGPCPENFPHKGEYRTWDKSWNPSGFSSEPQHPGQQPIRFPLWWKLWNASAISRL